MRGFFRSKKNSPMTSDNHHALGAQPCPWMISQIYQDGAWGPASIQPYGNLTLAPNTRALHYGQSVFEGIKAVKQELGAVALFRPRDHLARLQRSCERMCIPAPEVEGLLQIILELIDRLRDEVPQAPDYLYVRPFVFATQEDLIPGVSESYRLLVLCSPGRAIFGDAGVRLCTVPEQIRSAPGGTGSIKCAGNYAAALHARRQAKQRGFDEVLWLDAPERRWVEETGSMNLMLVRAGQLITPPLCDTILPGLTRASLLDLASAQGLPWSEERVPIDAPYWRQVSEVFSAGTVAGTAHVGEIQHQDKVLFRRSKPGPVAQSLAAGLGELLSGRAPDPNGWLEPVIPPTALPIRHLAWTKA